MATEYPVAGGHGLGSTIVELKVVDGWGATTLQDCRSRVEVRHDEVRSEHHRCLQSSCQGLTQLLRRKWHSHLRGRHTIDIGRRGPIGILAFHDTHDQRGVAHGEIGIDEMAGKAALTGFRRELQASLTGGGCRVSIH